MNIDMATELSDAVKDLIQSLPTAAVWTEGGDLEITGLKGNAPLGYEMQDVGYENNEAFPFTVLRSQFPDGEPEKRHKFIINEKTFSIRSIIEDRDFITYNLSLQK